MASKNVLLKKKIGTVIYDVLPQTDAANVKYGDTTVSATLAALATQVGTTSVDERIEAAKKEILGITDGSTIDAAYDTLKEIADWITSDTTGAASIVNRVSALEGTVGDTTKGLVKDVTDLKTTVGGSESGLVKDVADLKTTVGDSTSGLVKAVADLQAAATAVTKGDNNGEIKVDGQTVVVYDDSAIAATKITEDETHRFVTDAEKAAWNDDAAIKVVTADTMPSVDDASENDLYLVDLSAQA